jgi:hypothetical protein
MSDPRRWLDEGSDDALRQERDLLRSGLMIDPPDGAQDKVWASVLAQLGPGPMGGGPGSGLGGPIAAKAGIAASAAAGAGKAAGAAASAGIVKSLLLGAGSACVLLAGYAAVAPEERPRPQPVSVAAPVAAAPAAPRGVVEALPSMPPSPLNETRVRAPIEQHVAVSKPQVSAETSRLRAEPPAQPAREAVVAEPPPMLGVVPPSGAVASTGDVSVAAAERESRLREERQLVGEARSALRRGEPGGALSLLEQGRVRFPGGTMMQEREALAIEALWLGGQRAVASQRAAAFLRAYPLSPHAVRVQAFVH